MFNSIKKLARKVSGRESHVQKVQEVLETFYDKINKALDYNCPNGQYALVTPDKFQFDFRLGFKIFEAWFEATEKLSSITGVQLLKEDAYKGKTVAIWLERVEKTCKEFMLEEDNTRRLFIDKFDTMFLEFRYLNKKHYQKHSERYKESRPFKYNGDSCPLDPDELYKKKVFYSKRYMNLIYMCMRNEYNQKNFSGYSLSHFKDLFRKFCLLSYELDYRHDRDWTKFFSSFKSKTLEKNLEKKIEMIKEKIDKLFIKISGDILYPVEEGRFRIVMTKKGKFEFIVNQKSSDIPNDEDLFLDEYIKK